jgi:hypothetical protein
MHIYAAFAKEGILKRMQGTVLNDKFIITVDIDYLRLAFLLAEGILHREVLEAEIVAALGKDDTTAAGSGNSLAHYGLGCGTAAAAAFIALVVCIGYDGIIAGFAFKGEVILVADKDGFVVST